MSNPLYLKAKNMQQLECKLAQNLDKTDITSLIFCLTLDRKLTLHRM